MGFDLVDSRLEQKLSSLRNSHSSAGLCDRDNHHGSDDYSLWRTSVLRIL